MYEHYDIYKSPLPLGDDGIGGGGRGVPDYPGPIPNVPRDNISRKGIPSLRHGWGTKNVMNWVTIRDSEPILRVVKAYPVA